MRIVLLLCIIFLYAKLCISCPTRCDCRGFIVDCRRKGLRTVPRIPSWTILLDLRNNRIERLNKHAFTGLLNLKTLLLSNNRISNIEQDFLDILPSLRSIMVDRNKLEHLTYRLASNAHNLNDLDLSFNRISQIDRSFFDNLEILQTINLSGNKLQTLPPNFFDYSFQKLFINLEGNPLNCDCRWHDPLIRLNDSPVCWYPILLRGKLLSQMKKSEFTCITPIVQSLKLETELSLRCPIEEHTYNDERTIIVWVYRNFEIVPENDDMYQKFGDDSLVIRNDINPTDFKCSVNYLPSRVRRLANVLMPPQFTLKPKDRLYREGTNVRLDCEVIGRPEPRIRWYFNGKELKKSRKYQLNHKGTVLNLYPFLEKDVGIYTCIAENIYGQIKASATLHIAVSSPPEILEEPKSITVRAGETVRFRCKARAEPDPFITWFFDGSEIATFQGHYQISDDNSELSIIEARKSDDGTYSCMAGNTVGSMMADARLIVQSGSKDDHILQISENALLTAETLKNIVNEAAKNIDRAIQATRTRPNMTSPRELIKWFHFAVPRNIELSRAREIYEESIRLIQKHVEKGLSLIPNELSHDVSFESVLVPSHIDMLTELAGCSGTRVKDPCDDNCFHSLYRSFDGQCNNLNNPMWGASNMRFRRLLQPSYENGFNTPIGWDPDKLYFGYRKPNPRLVSNKLIQTKTITPHQKFSSMLMQWGQFIDHDLDFTATAISRHAFTTGAICNTTCENTNPCFNIPLSKDDLKMRKKPQYACIEFERSSAVCGSGETSLIYRNITFREQMNIITSYIDGSGIYGSTEKEAYELRELHPDRGILRFDTFSEAGKTYLPFERDSPMDCRRNFSVDNPIRCFLAGDYRANEQLGLISMHTLFMREHNRIANELRLHNPYLDGETIFQEARKIVGAELQHITFQDWLPKIFGQDGFDRLIGSYQGYHNDIDASISNAFATAAFRFGHTLINPILYRLDERFLPITAGNILLRDSFFAPEQIFIAGGIDPLIRGLFASRMKKPHANELLNFELTEELFNRAHDVALDLAAMNIQRGRDHGLPGYVEYRKWCNLSKIETWDDMKNAFNEKILLKLRELYGHPGNIDLFVGGIAETRFRDSLIGPTFSCIIAEQFRRIRDGDRFWYEKDGVFSDAQLNEIKNITLSRIICDNADGIDRIQRDAFEFVGNSIESFDKCEKLPSFNLKHWRNCCNNRCSVSKNRYRTSQRRKRFLNECKWKDKLLMNGFTWNENCLLCTCKEGKVQCQSSHDCRMERK